MLAGAHVARPDPAARQPLAAAAHTVGARGARPLADDWLLRAVFPPASGNAVAPHVLPTDRPRARDRTRSRAVRVTYGEVPVSAGTAVARVAAQFGDLQAGADVPGLPTALSEPSPRLVVTDEPLARAAWTTRYREWPQYALLDISATSAIRPGDLISLHDPATRDRDAAREAALTVVLGVHAGTASVLVVRRQEANIAARMLGRVAAKLP